MVERRVEVADGRVRREPEPDVEEAQSRAGENAEVGQGGSRCRSSTSPRRGTDRASRGGAAVLEAPSEGEPVRRSSTSPRLARSSRCTTAPECPPCRTLPGMTASVSLRWVISVLNKRMDVLMSSSDIVVGPPPIDSSSGCAAALAIVATPARMAVLARRMAVPDASPFIGPPLHQPRERAAARQSRTHHPVVTSVGPVAESGCGNSSLERRRRSWSRRTYVPRTADRRATRESSMSEVETSRCVTIRNSRLRSCRSGRPGCRVRAGVPPTGSRRAPPTMRSRFERRQGSSTPSGPDWPEAKTAPGSRRSRRRAAQRSRDPLLDA